MKADRCPHCGSNHRVLRTVKGCSIRVSNSFGYMILRYGDNGKDKPQYQAAKENNER